MHAGRAQAGAHARLAVPGQLVALGAQALLHAALARRDVVAELLGVGAAQLVQHSVQLREQQADRPSLWLLMTCGAGAAGVLHQPSNSRHGVLPSCNSVFCCAGKGRHASALCSQVMR